MTLGVTFESEILCDISRGLSYTWTFWNSQGWPVPLPPAVSTHRQTVTVPSYFLEPGNYTALARVSGWLTYVPPASEQELSPGPSNLLCPRKRGLSQVWLGSPEMVFLGESKQHVQTQAKSS